MVDHADHEEAFDCPERGADPIRGDEIAKDFGREADREFLVERNLEEEGGKPDKDQKNEVDPCKSSEGSAGSLTDQHESGYRFDHHQRAEKKGRALDMRPFVVHKPLFNLLIEGVVDNLRKPHDSH